MSGDSTLTIHRKVGGLVTRVKVLDRRVSHPSPVLWLKVGVFMRATWRKQFTTEGSFLLGRPWHPLKPDYAHWKAHHGGRGKILQASGDLRNSFLTPGRAVQIIHGTYAIYGSSSKLAVFHQYGTHRHGKRVLPPRPIMKRNAYVTNGIKKIVVDYVTSNPKIGEGAA